MNDLEKLKRKRATLHTVVTKLITKYDFLFSVAVGDTNCDALMESVEILKKKENAQNWIPESMIC